MAVPWLAGPPLRQLEELGAWGEMLRSDMIVAYTADAMETGAPRGELLASAYRGPGLPSARVAGK